MNLKSEPLIEKQKCADRLQLIVKQQVNCLRQIQNLGYEPTPELKATINQLDADYKIAYEAFSLASTKCDITVYVTPITL